MRKDIWLCGKTDEDNLEFTYATLNAYLFGEEIDEATKAVIERKHRANLHKENPMPVISK